MPLEETEGGGEAEWKSAGGVGSRRRRRRGGSHLWSWWWWSVAAAPSRPLERGRSGEACSVKEGKVGRLVSVSRMRASALHLATLHGHRKRWMQLAVILQPVQTPFRCVECEWPVPRHFRLPVNFLFLLSFHRVLVDPSPVGTDDRAQGRG